MTSNNFTIWTLIRTKSSIWSQTTNRIAAIIQTASYRAPSPSINRWWGSTSPQPARWRRDSAWCRPLPFAPRSGVMFKHAFWSILYKNSECLIFQGVELSVGEHQLVREQRCKTEIGCGRDHDRWSVLRLCPEHQLDALCLRIPIQTASREALPRCRGIATFTLTKRLLEIISFSMASLLRTYTPPSQRVTA